MVVDRILGMEWILLTFAMKGNLEDTLSNEFDQKRQARKNFETMAPNDQKHDPSDSLPQEGDQVSWKWAGGNPTGDVVGVTTGETQIKTDKGNTIARHGTKADPAVEIVTHSTGKTVLKKASEITVEEKATENKNRGKKRREVDISPETEVPPAAKKKKIQALEKKLDEMGATKDLKEIVKEHVNELTKDDWKEPVGRRTRSQTSGKSNETEAEKLEKGLFEQQ